MRSQILSSCFLLFASLLQADLVFYPALERIIPSYLMLEMTTLFCPEALQNAELFQDITINKKQMELLFENPQLIDQENKSDQWKSDCKKLMLFVKKNDSKRS